MTKKLTLEIEDLEDRVAPDIGLPNGMVMFEGFGSQSPQFSLHPSLENGVEPNSNFHGFGPWSAAIYSDNIEFIFP